MAGPGDEEAATAGLGRSGLRASDSDREQVISALKSAFVQGRLTRDELGARAGQAYASTTYAELAAVIADIATPLAQAWSSRAPWRATRRALFFAYAVFAPGIVAVLLLPGGPGITVWTFVIFAAVAYTLFWLLGMLWLIGSRRVRSSGELPLQPPSWYEREKVTSALRAALAQGRLTDDELEARVAETSAARSRAELAALTADLPADLVARQPRARYAWTGVCVILAAAGAIAALLLLQPDNYAAFALGLSAAVVVILAPPITVGLMIDARHQKRTRALLQLGPVTAL
jgi:hypothetical protein